MAVGADGIQDLSRDLVGAEALTDPAGRLVGHAVGLGHVHDLGRLGAAIASLDCGGCRRSRRRPDLGLGARRGRGDRGGRGSCIDTHGSYSFGGGLFDRELDQIDVGCGAGAAETDLVVSGDGFGGDLVWHPAAAVGGDAGLLVLGHHLHRQDLVADRHGLDVPLAEHGLLLLAQGDRREARLAAQASLLLVELDVVHRTEVQQPLVGLDQGQAILGPGEIHVAVRVGQDLVVLLPGVPGEAADGHLAGERDGVEADLTVFAVSARLDFDLEVPVLDPRHLHRARVDGSRCAHASSSAAFAKARPI